MARYRYRRYRRKKEKRPFRLLDLPAELQLMVFEEAALSSTITGPHPQGTMPPIALLQTCKQIRSAAILMYNTLAAFKITVLEWNFEPVHDAVDKINSLPVLPRTQEKQDVILVLEYRKWMLYHEELLEDWLASHARHVGFEWIYSVEQTREEREGWKSRQKYRKNRGVQQLQDFRYIHTSPAACREIDEIIQAIDEESFYVAVAHAQMAAHTISGGKAKFKLGKPAHDALTDEICSAIVEMGFVRPTIMSDPYTVDIAGETHW